MKQVLIKGGAAFVDRVPAPQVSPRNILVQVTHSCISVGTELAGLKSSAMPLYRRALKQPENVRKVVNLVKDKGLQGAIDRVRGKLASGSPTGYSATGVIVAVGAQVTGFSIGDTVACAGAGIANHAEFIDVPVNLAARVPEGLPGAYAATVTLGAIAMQGVRRSAPSLGETFVVVGLGILGQITAQLLKANGCRVIGVDPDARRIEVALKAGLWKGVNPQDSDYVQRVHLLTDGFGADGVIVTAATASHEVISLAANACRKKGRVVLVGDVGLNLNRADFYKKELDFLISCSYGPGRYDPVYEEEGSDYPLPYVRWTENRNMESYLQLLADGAVRLDLLAPAIVSVDKAREAYARLNAPGEKPLIVVLEYPQEIAKADSANRIGQAAAARTRSNRVRVALVGAGGFAQGMHLPNLAKLKQDYEIRTIVSRTGTTAKAVATQYEAKNYTTDFEAALSDPEVDLVLIATRHAMHAPMVLQALRAGKHVFVEKPLAVRVDELEEIRSYYLQPRDQLLMTGYNRRFSPAVSRLRQLLEGRTTPLVVNYRMNAGYIPLDSWIQGMDGAGRNIGEACHIYDLFHALTGARCIEVQANAIRPTGKQWLRNDNFVAILKFDDGSLCTLTYTALGSKSYPKERMDVFVDGLNYVLDDYRSLEVFGSKRRGWQSDTVEKGQFEEVQALAKCLRSSAEWPISLDDQISVASLALGIEGMLI